MPVLGFNSSAKTQGDKFIIQAGQESDRNCNQGYTEWIDEDIDGRKKKKETGTIS